MAFHSGKKVDGQLGVASPLVRDGAKRLSQAVRHCSRLHSNSTLEVLPKGRSPEASEIEDARQRNVTGVEMWTSAFAWAVESRIFNNEAPSACRRHHWSRM